MGSVKSLLLLFVFMLTIQIITCHWYGRFGYPRPPLPPPGLYGGFGYGGFYRPYPQIIIAPPPPPFFG